MTGSNSSGISDDKPERSETAGAKPMSITGRMQYEMYRLEGMTTEEREWRKKWLKDQQLSPREPILIPTNSPDLMNPIRRLYRKPLDVVFFKLLPIKNESLARVCRYYTGKIFLGLAIAYMGFYYFKYNSNKWTSVAAWRIVRDRSVSYPGDPDFPSLQTKTKGSEYVDAGFSKSIFAGGRHDTPRTAAET